MDFIYKCIYFDKYPAWSMWGHYEHVSVLNLSLKISLWVEVEQLLQLALERF